jgi:hypothetical protein
MQLQASFAWTNYHREWDWKILVFLCMTKGNDPVLERREFNGWLARVRMVGSTRSIFWSEVTLITADLSGPAGAIVNSWFLFSPSPIADTRVLIRQNSLCWYFAFVVQVHACGWGWVLAAGFWVWKWSLEHWCEDAWRHVLTVKEPERLIEGGTAACALILNDSKSWFVSSVIQIWVRSTLFFPMQKFIP